MLTPAGFADDVKFWIAFAMSSMVVCPSLFAMKNFSAMSHAIFMFSQYFLITAIIQLKAVVVSVPAPTAVIADNSRILLTFWNSTHAEDMLNPVSSSSSFACQYKTEMFLI